MEKTMHLREGTLLQGGRYRIESVLGQGGFGITYLAVQTGLERKVALKEFFMKGVCNRDEETSGVNVPSVGSQELVEKFKNKFIKEARMISAHKHKHIVEIHDIFEENDTAYYVMEYHEASLASFALPLTVSRVERYIRQVASALSFLHSDKIMHLDVKPANILIDKDDNAILIDFGVSKRYDEGGHQTSSTPVGISHGYAPIEQYSQTTLTFSPTTDIYALGATMYKLLTGQMPPETSVVNDEGLPEFPSWVPASVGAVVERAMQPKRKDRPQSIEAFLALLDASIAGPAEVSEADNVDDTEGLIEEQHMGPNARIDLNKVRPDTPAAKPRKRRVWIWVSLLLLALGCGVGLFFWWSNNRLGPIDGNHEGYDYVDLGLQSGNKWAACNIDARTPADKGGYFSMNDVPYMKGRWQLPDKEDFEELISTCKWSWTTYKGCNGYKVTGPNGHSIFFPAVGFDAPPYGVIDETKRVGVYIGAENTGSRLGEGKSRHVLYFDSQDAGAGVRNDDNLYTIRMVLK